MTLIQTHVLGHSPDVAPQAGRLDFTTVGTGAPHEQLARHLQLFGCTGGQPAQEVSRWFDTDFHYLAPEFGAATVFALDSQPLLDEVAQAQALGQRVKVALLGPLTLLWLGRCETRLDLLERLLPEYARLLVQLRAAGVEWVQLEEPILGLDLPYRWRNAFEPAYWLLNQTGAQLMLATYFAPLGDKVSLACRLPVAGLHVDAVRAAQELTSVADWLPAHKVLSIGIVDGRDNWRTDLDAALATLLPVLGKRSGPVWLSASCSLVHVPPPAAMETARRPWHAFADEKVAELALLKSALSADERVCGQVARGFTATRSALAARGLEAA